MDRANLIESMTGLLSAAVDAQGEQHELEIASDSPLVGGDAVLSSLALVTYILDVEGHLDAEHGLQVTLVNEDALSRSQSPFRTVETLADYVLELAGVAPAQSAESEAESAESGATGEPAEGAEQEEVAPERRVARA